MTIGRPRPPAVAHQLENGTWLVPRFAAASMIRRSEYALRRRCRPMACDIATRTTLYDIDEVCVAFGETPLRDLVLT